MFVKIPALISNIDLFDLQKTFYISVPLVLVKRVGKVI